MTTGIDTKDPQFLAYWTKCIRETSQWSQEALAASSGLDVRTIQRIEAGHRISITTRRALARGLGYDNPDVFEDPEFIKSMNDFFSGIRKFQDEEVQRQFPDHMRISVRRVSSAEDLARIAYDANAYLLHSDEEIADEAKEVAASIFDFLRDIGDLGDVASYSDRLGFQRSLDAQLEQLEALETACYFAFRRTEIVGADGADEKSIPLTIGYLTVVPVGSVLTEMMVPRGLS